MENKAQIATLNTLIATTIDSVKGYEISAQNIDNENFREIFRQNADERQQVVGQLREEVRRLGGDPEDDGTFMGKAHQRFWTSRPRSPAATKRRSSTRSSAARTISRRSSRPLSTAATCRAKAAPSSSAPISPSAPATTRSAPQARARSLTLQLPLISPGTDARRREKRRRLLLKRRKTASHDCGTGASGGPSGPGRSAPSTG